MFAMVCFWLFLDLRDIGPQADGRALRRFALGACTGFAIWFNYSCLLFLAVLLLFDALFDRRIWRAREFSVQLAGVLVGALPWLFYNVRNDWAGLSIYGTSLVDHVASGDGHADSLARLFDLSARALPGAFYFRDFAGVERGIWDALSCSVLFGLALAPWFLTRRPRPVPYLMAWTYLAVFTLAYSLSDFEVGKPEDDIRGWRYVMLPIPFLTLAAACGLDAIAKRSNTFLRVAWLIAVVWAGSSFLGTTGFVDGTRAFADLQREGSSQAHFGRWMALRYAKEPAVLGRLCSRAVELRSEADQAAFFGGMANALRNFSIKQPSMTPKELARAEDYRVAMDWLSQNAPDTYRSFFQVAEPLK